jgi:hypothetical protein
VAEKACAKLKALLGKKEAQLDRVSEEAQKAATMMKEEMNSLQVSSCMLVYAGVCSWMPTYADLCLRMLTYADVC